jgi:hypothetical protein
MLPGKPSHSSLLPFLSHVCSVFCVVPVAQAFVARLSVFLYVLSLPNDRYMIANETLQIATKQPKPAPFFADAIAQVGVEITVIARELSDNRYLECVVEGGPSISSPEASVCWSWGVWGCCYPGPRRLYGCPESLRIDASEGGGQQSCLAQQQVLSGRSGLVATGATGVEPAEDINEDP